MANILGIDLGTTYSAMARLDENGTPLIVENSDGENLTPSVIEFTGKNSIIVGTEAKKAYLIAADKSKFAKDAKREIRINSEQTWNAFGKEHSPTSVSSLILKYLKESYEKQHGAIDSVVITIPANFKNQARSATVEAANKAGLENVELIDEPTAAAFAYAFSSGKKLNGNYVIYDLGGGTFDVSVAQIKGKDIKILAKEGIGELGGRDFDHALYELIAKKFKNETGKDLSEGEVDKALNLEEQKKSLSKRDLNISLSIRGKGAADFKITQKQFNAAISTDVTQTITQCELVLEDANLSKNDITEVLLVGGSTRVPLVNESVNEFFGQEAKMVGNPDEAVALGAAIYSAYKIDSRKLNASQKNTMDGVKIDEITGSAFGTSALVTNPMDPNQSIMVNSIIIEKGVQRPCSVTQDYYTVHDNQTKLHLDVTEAEDNNETDLEWVTKIWEGDMELPEGRDKGCRIDITFSFDDSGIMHCEFKDVESKRVEEIDLDINRKMNDSAQKIDIDEFKVE